MRRRALIGASGDIPIPAGYERLKYLESSGKQYIEPGISFDLNNTIVRFSIIPTSVPSSTSTFLGHWDGYAFYFATYRPASGNNWMFLLWQDGWFDSQVAIEIGKQYDMVWDGLKNRDIEINGAQVFSIPEYTAHNFLPFLFALNDYGGPGQYFTGKLLSGLYIEDTSGVRADMIALLRSSDNKPLLYNRATEEFYANAGMGEFGYEKFDGTYVEPI